MAHDRISLIEWETLFVGTVGARGAEAVVEELGDEVFV